MLNKIKEIYQKKINTTFLIIGIMHFIMTFFTDNIMFNFEYETFQWGNFIFCKMLSFFVIQAGWQYIAKVFIKKDEEARKYFKYFLIYTIPMLILLFLIWPGVWFGSDVYNFLSMSESAQYLYYLHYLTSIFYIVAYIIFPVPTGAIILLVLSFGITVAYIVKRSFDIFKGNKWTYLMYFPFIMLHTVWYTFFANRPVIFGIYYLLLISIIVFDKIQEKSLTTKKLLTLAILTAIVANWRTESVYLALSIPLFIFLTYKVKINWKNIIKIGGIVILAMLIVKIPQSINTWQGGEMAGVRRTLPMYVSPLSYMLTMDLEGENLEEDLENIDVVLNVEAMKQYPSFTDTPCIWKAECLRTGFTMKEFETFQSSYINIISNNFDKFLYTKTLTFGAATNVFIDSFSSIGLYYSNDNTIAGYESSKTFLDFHWRLSIVAMLEGKSVNDFTSSTVYRLFNNLLIPFVAIGIMFIVSMLKKNLYYFLLSGMFLAHIFIVFITAPASYFMYYFPIHLCGMVSIFYVIVKTLVESKVSRKEEENE